MGSFLERAGLPAIVGPNNLVLRFPADYNQAREYCQEPTRLGRIEEAIRKLSGRPWTVRVEGGPGSTAATPVQESAPDPAPRPRRNHRAEAEKEPVVKRALNALGAQVLRVDEGFGETPAGSVARTAEPPDEES